MKIDNSGYAAKAVLLVISGALIAFFPQIVNWIFYILGGIIVVSCLFILLTSMGSGDGRHRSLSASPQVWYSQSWASASLSQAASCS